MTKFVLIFIIFLPVTNEFDSKVGIFNTLKECMNAKTRVLPQIKNMLPKNSQFILICERGIPANNIQT